MPEKILFVDDERNILETYKRQFRKQYDVDLALGPEMAIEKLAQCSSYAVIISDFCMPNMDGVQFLNVVKNTIPKAARILITGFADVNTAMKAVNEGAVFRFLTKPCPHELLTEAIRAGVEHSRLLRTEKDVLESSLIGCLSAITEVFSIFYPDSFGHISRVQRYVRGMVKPMNLADSWRLEVSVMLAHFGTFTLPRDLIHKKYQGQSLSNQERELFEQHPQTGADLLTGIPRFKEVAEIIRYQEKKFDGSGPPQETKQGTDIPLESRMLKVVLDFDALEEGGHSREEAFHQLEAHAEWYDPDCLRSLQESLETEDSYFSESVSLKDLTANMILADSVRDDSDAVIVTKGQLLTDRILLNLVQISFQRKIQEPVKVLIPQ